MIALFSSKSKSTTPENISQNFYKKMIYGSINVLLSLPEFRDLMKTIIIEFPEYNKYWSKTLDWEIKINISSDIITKIYDFFINEGLLFAKSGMISENFTDMIYFLLNDIYMLKISENINLFTYTLQTFLISQDGLNKQVLVLTDAGSIKLFQLTNKEIGVNLNKYKNLQEKIHDQNFSITKQIFEKCPLYLFACLKEENNYLLELIKTDNYHCLLLSSTKYELVGFVTFNIFLNQIYYFILRDNGIYRIDKEVRIKITKAEAIKFLENNKTEKACLFKKA